MFLAKAEPLITKKEFESEFNHLNDKFRLNVFRMKHFVLKGEMKSDDDSNETVLYRKNAYNLYSSYKAFSDLCDVDRKQLFYSDLDVSIFTYKFVESIEKSIKTDEFDVCIVLKALFSEIEKMFDKPIIFQQKEKDDSPPHEMVGPHHEMVGPPHEMVGPRHEMVGPSPRIMFRQKSDESSSSSPKTEKKTSLLDRMFKTIFRKSVVVTDADEEEMGKDSDNDSLPSYDEALMA